MAIQVRRGTNAEWENTNQNIVAGEPAVALDSERFFVGTGAGTYAEYANVKSIASAYSTSRAYREGDYVMYNGKLYVCTTATTGGAWNAANWEETSLLDAMTGDIPYRNYETTSVSGDIASFDNGAGGIPVKDLEVEVAATQNMNGYDHPWVGGAGVNLWGGLTVEKMNTDGTFSPSTSDWHSPKINIGSQTKVTLKIYENSSYTSGSIGIDAFDSNGTRVQSTNFVNTVHISSYPYTTTLTFSGSPSYFYIRGYRSGGASTITSVKAQVEFGDTATDYQPYENICPISGWDEVNVYVAGKNLLPNIANSSTINGVTFTKNSDDSVTANGTARGNAIFYFLGHQDKTIIYPSGTYIMSGCPSGGTSSTYRFSAFNNQGSGYQHDYGSGATFSSLASGMKFAIVVFSGTTVNNLVFKPMIRLASVSDATYEPYNGQTYTTDLDSTVYGGTLDVTTGELILTHEYIDLGTYGINGTAVSSNVRRWYTTQNSAFKKVTLCNSLKASDSYVYTSLDYASISTDHRIAVTPTWGQSITTIADFNTAIANNPISVVIELATPQTVQLNSIQVETLLRENNIWADSGRIINCTYRITNT